MIQPPPCRLLPLLALAWIGFSVSVRAAEPDPAALARKAHDILKTHCHACHGQDGKVEGGLNYILDLKKLVARKKIIPGDPAKSKLLRRVTSPDDPMLPVGEKTRPSKAEIALLQQWIEAGAADLPRTASARPFLTEAAILQSILEDLDTIDPRYRPFARYFTITHLHNAALSDDELQTYRHGLSKLLNSLSWKPVIVVPKSVDQARTVFRIDLRDYQWTALTWKNLLEKYPYGLLQATAVTQAIQAATGCEQSHVRADWFVFAASRPPLYHDLLQLPRTDRELERALKVDAMANIQEQRVARAGFNASGVSRNNRLIERHESPNGAYWKSYDFAGNVGRQNLFAFPLGPGPGENAFQHDGGEIIFNLPNGLQAYLLVDGKGNRIDEGPTKIVSVPNKPDPTVINGISCMSCHARGTIDKADQVRAHVEKNLASFTEADAKTIQALYPLEADFKTLLQQDAERFRKATAATGVQLGDTEPVVALAARFEAELDLVTAAAEAGLTPAVFLRKLDGAAGLAQHLGPLKVEGGTVKRQVFVEAFEDLAQAFHLGTSLAALNRAIAEATESIRLQPKNASPFFDRANAYFDKRDFQQAIADYTEALRRGFQGAEIYQNRAMAHVLKRDFDLAIADYDAAIRLDPKRAPSFHNRGLAHVRQGDQAKAIADLSEALRLDPANAAAFSDRGFVHLKQGNHDKAIADYSAALKLDPVFPGAHLRRGDLYRLKKDYDGAVVDYTEALRLQPSSSGLYLHRGNAHDLNRAFAKALADYQEAARLDPKNPECHNELAWLLATCPDAKVRDGRNAVEHATRARELNGWKEPAFLDTLAVAHAECGQFEEAIRWEKQARDLASRKEKDEYGGRLELFQKGKPYQPGKR